jgi:heterotetrameric sarcosine oxidase gamma subunit
VAKLNAKTSAEGLLPLTEGKMMLTEAKVREIWSIAPYPGQDAGIPSPNRASGKEGARMIWAGRDQALWIGTNAPDQTLAEIAALTDQSDALTVVRLDGEGANDALSRLTPLDLRESQFKRGHTARTLVGHMAAQITRTTKGFEIMVFRSMAGTLVHELHVAMRSVAARSET